jgi:hypothetical protein
MKPATLNTSTLSLSSIILASSLVKIYGKGHPNLLVEIISGFRLSLKADKFKAPKCDLELVKLAIRIRDENSFLLEVL